MKEKRFMAKCNRVFLYCDCGGFMCPTKTKKGDLPLYGNKCDMCNKIRELCT
jgi:hypothetical protein